MKTTIFLALTILASVLAETKTHAASLGDAAPPLPIERWIKGTPVRVGPGANIFVVEFWATWCGPCKRSIPHLTEVQKKFANRGVVVIGVSDEPVADVQPFVAGQGDNMNYRVAVDSSRRSFQNWMKAYGESGIPHAFIVGTNGTVLWHDFPSENLDKALERIVAGTYDLGRAQNKETGERLVLQYTALVTKANAAAKSEPLGNKIIADFSQDWRVPHHLAKAILTDPEVRSRDVPLALRATTKAVELTDRRSSDALGLHGRALFASGKKTEGLETLKEALATCDDPDDKAELQKLLALLEKGPTAPTKAR